MARIMRLEEIKNILEADIVAGSEYLDKEIGMACGSDLMSDVLAFIKSDSLLLTGLTNVQVVRTAEMAEVSIICFVRGKKPQRKTMELAMEEEIPLLVTRFSMFESCGRLYKEGLLGCDALK